MVWLSSKIILNSLIFDMYNRQCHHRYFCCQFYTSCSNLTCMKPHMHTHVRERPHASTHTHRYIDTKTDTHTHKHIFFDIVHSVWICMLWPNQFTLYIMVTSSNNSWYCLVFLYVVYSIFGNIIRAIMDIITFYP
jgi:hypothetical protein